MREELAYREDTHAHPIDHPALRLFGELLAVPARSGREERLAQLVRAKLKGWGLEPETDPAGNVIVRVAGRDAGPPLCLAAHMDEMGLVVTRVEPMPFNINGRRFVSGFVGVGIGRRMAAAKGDRPATCRANALLQAYAPSFPPSQAWGRARASLPV